MLPSSSSKRGEEAASPLKDLLQSPKLGPTSRPGSGDGSKSSGKLRLRKPSLGLPTAVQVAPFALQSVSRSVSQPVSHYHTPSGELMAHTLTLLITAQVVFSPNYFTMEHEQMMKLAETLEKWEVPAILGTRCGMHLLLGNALLIFGERQGQPAQFIIGMALTSTNAGLGLDVGRAMSEYCKAAIHHLLTWVRAAGTAYESGVQDASTRLYAEMGELFDRDMCERAELRREFSPESFFLLTGSEDQLKRNAHTDPRGAVGGHLVEWSALLAPGLVRLQRAPGAVLPA